MHFKQICYHIRQAEADQDQGCRAACVVGCASESCSRATVQKEGRMRRTAKQMEAALQAMEADTSVEQFRAQLTAWKHDFEQHLLQTLAPRTVRKQAQIVHYFIDFVCWNTRARTIEAITVAMANSAFRRWYMSNIQDATESELKTVIKKFFVYLHQQQGMTNMAVLNSFARKRGTKKSAQES
jgi:hypothetical protein